MFEHFSEQSMKVMALADREAAALKHDRVGTGEILVGLLVWAEASGAADNAVAEAADSNFEKAEKFARNFSAFNLTAAKVRAEVKRITGSGAGERASAYSFTPGAEVLLLLAYEEALNLCKRPGTEKVEPEHLLLALLRQDEGVACRILERLGLNDFSQLRAAVLSSLGVNQEDLIEIRFEKARRQRVSVQLAAGELAGHGSLTDSQDFAHPGDLAMLATAEKLLTEGLQAGASLVDLPYSPYAIELFKLAQEAANNHGHDVVGSGHLLLAALSMHKGMPLRVMAQCGVERYQVDEELSNILGPGSGVAPDSTLALSWSASCSKLLSLAAHEALEWHHSFIGLEHVLLVLLREHEGVAGRILEDFAVDKGALRNKILADEQFGSLEA
ncbi:MAG: Clp protease N-terminal domain-containing protein [Candidatus Obscuribacterales bacterium]